MIKGMKAIIGQKDGVYTITLINENYKDTIVVDEIQFDHAEKLCKIYFDIASEAIGKDEVRRRRDKIISGNEKEELKRPGR